MAEPEDDGAIYKVVMNHEEQYSIWPADRDNAPGWRDEGKRGTRQDCLDHIKAVWTDMRPLSLRKKMESAG
jgi:MbtH protein